MKTEYNKFSFAADLKASNIEVNVISLDEYSKQIALLLDQINVKGNIIAEKNLKSSMEAINDSLKATPMEKLDEYIKLGELLLFLIPNIKSEDIKFIKQIAICYLDIAKLVNDERVKKISFTIADKLINNGN